MKFKSRKDTLFNLIAIGNLSILIAIVVYITTDDFSWANLLILLVVSAVIGLILWIYFDTSYLIRKNKLYYKSGPFRGNIEINNIYEIIKGKTMWAGLKPATAQKGLIVKYNKYNEIYISPKNNDSFIAELLKLNSRIEITE
ncbi:MAG: PH domain-containing protein [Aequorivita sp.]